MLDIVVSAYHHHEFDDVGVYILVIGGNCTLSELYSEIINNSIRDDSKVYPYITINLLPNFEKNEDSFMEKFRLEAEAMLEAQGGWLLRGFERPRRHTSYEAIYILEREVYRNEFSARASIKEVLDWVVATVEKHGNPVVKSIDISQAFKITLKGKK